MTSRSLPTTSSRALPPGLTSPGMICTAMSMDSKNEEALLHAKRVRRPASIAAACMPRRLPCRTNSTNPRAVLWGEGVSRGLHAHAESSRAAWKRSKKEQMKAVSSQQCSVQCHRAVSIGGQWAVRCEGNPAALLCFPPKHNNLTGYGRYEPDYILRRVTPVIVLGTGAQKHAAGVTKSHFCATQPRPVCLRMR